MTLILRKKHAEVDRRDGLDVKEWWLDLILKQISRLNLPKAANLPLRARYFNSDVEVGAEPFEWVETEISANADDLPFPIIPNLVVVQFFIDRAWYCFHHGLWHYKPIAGKQTLVIDRPQ
jgi:hypothetical protein